MKTPALPRRLPARPRPARQGNALVLAVCWIALFSLIVTGVYTLTQETTRHAARQNNFTSTEAAADSAMDVLYGRFTHWVDAHTGLTPSIADANAADLKSPQLTAPIDFSSVPGLSDYTVALNTTATTGCSLVPLMPDDSQIGATDFPNWTTWGSNPGVYQGVANRYYTFSPNLYDPTANPCNALNYRATLTVTPKAGTDSLHPGAVTLTRVFQKGEVSPFNYNIFTEGTYEAGEYGQGYDSEASIYASVDVKLDHKGTIVNGNIHYGDAFIDPTGVTGGTNTLVFQDPKTNATLDPTGSGYLRQVSKIEVVPDLVDVIAHDANPPNGLRAANGSQEFTSAADNFSRREIIEPPANLANDTAPDQIKQRRIYNQADARIKISTVPNKGGKKGDPQTLATATFYNLDGSTLASYTGTPNGAGTTAWQADKGNGGKVTDAIVKALNVNTVDSTTPFYDFQRTNDPANPQNQPGQATAANLGHAIETVDVNVGALTNAINANPASSSSLSPTSNVNSNGFAANILYIWDDGASGEKNGVRLYNGGILPGTGLKPDGTPIVGLNPDGTAIIPANLPASGLTIGTTDPVYVKGDFNTGTTLTSDVGGTPTNDQNAVPILQPLSNTLGNNGQFVTADQRHTTPYVPAPAGVFGDTVTGLSQNWRDALSKGTDANGNPTLSQQATSTTFNAVLGTGSGDANALQKYDTFTNGQYAAIQYVEIWNNTRWNQLGEQMALYHSIYSLHKQSNPWIGANLQWAFVQSDFDPRTARLPLKWGYLVFSRGRYTRN